MNYFIYFILFIFKISTRADGDISTAGKKKLIIDTDAGADDAVAILNVLGQEELFHEVETVMITTVRGNTEVDHVGRNILKILMTVKRLNIPVYPGARDSLLFNAESDNYFGIDGFGDFNFPNPPPEDIIKKKHAVNALVEAVSNSPGELILICLGPLTNIALAIRICPKFLDNLKEIYILGGSVNGIGNVRPGVEFNVWIDPEAAMIVFKDAEKKNKTLNVMPWETALNVDIDIESFLNLFPQQTPPYYDSIYGPASYFKEKLKHPHHVKVVWSTEDENWRKNVLGVIPSAQIDLLNKAEVKLLQEEEWIPCDCFLTAAVLDPKIVESRENFSVNIEVCGQFARGGLYVDYFGTTKKTKNIQLIQKINKEKFMSMMLTNLHPRGGSKNEASRSV